MEPSTDYDFKPLKLSHPKLSLKERLKYTLLEKTFIVHRYEAGKTKIWDKIKTIMRYSLIVMIPLCLLTLLIITSVSATDSPNQAADKLVQLWNLAGLNSIYFMLVIIIKLERTPITIGYGGI